MCAREEHYLFLQATSKKCKRCLRYWLQNGADLARGTANHPEWITLEGSQFQRQAGSPEIAHAARMEESNLPGPFCTEAELGTYLRVFSKHARKYARQLRQQEREHHLFLRAAGSLCKECVQAWLGRGADKSRGTSCCLLKTAHRLPREAHADEK